MRLIEVRSFKLFLFRNATVPLSGSCSLVCDDEVRVKMPVSYLDAHWLTSRLAQ